MKKIIITAAVIAAAQFSKAQFSAEMNYGYRNPIGSGTGQAFTAANGFGARVLRKTGDSKWEYGISFNRQSFASSEDFFRKDHNARFKNSSLLFSLRKEVKFKASHIVYWGADAGPGLNKYIYSRPGLATATRSTAFVAGFIMGANWYISRNISLDISGTYYRMKTGPLNVDDQFSSTRFKTLALDAGLKFSFNEQP